MKAAATKNRATDLHIAITIKNEAAWRHAMTRVRPLVKKAVCAALDSQLDLPAGLIQLSVLLTNDAEVRRLNKFWRGLDKPTNVLSFPATSLWDKKRKNKKSPAAPEPILLGDVVLARETVFGEARRENKTPSAHMSHLLVHGVLHLLGYDHVRLRAAKIMENLEREILATLKISDPYEPSTLGSRAPRSGSPRKGKAA